MYTSFKDDSKKPNELSRVTATCPKNSQPDDIICDKFQVGIIGAIEYEMYDIAVMITDTPDQLLARDYATISFRISHWDTDFIDFFAAVRMFCLVVTCLVILTYLVTSCSRKCCSANPLADLDFEQVCVLVLLVLCAWYDDPFFMFRRIKPSVTLAVLAEIPASFFFTGLLVF